MGTTRRWPIAITCLALAAGCSGGGGARTPTANPPTGAATSTPSAPSSSGTPTATAGPVATGRTAASPEWKAVKGAKLIGGSALLDVAATGPRDAWAVGYKESAEDREGTPALQHWDGSRWTETAVSSLDAFHLVGVSAGGPDDVWIVGEGQSPYAAHWNGDRWTGRHPFGIAENYHLTDVATNRGRAWMVGSTPSQGVIIEWNGRGFRNVLQADGQFSAVTVKPGHVWAVGTDTPPSSGTPGSPMIWHGTAVSGSEIQSWQRERTPDIPGGVLKSVRMITPSDVWAVGTVSSPGDPASSPGGRVKTPLVLHWDGTSWQRADVPVPRGALDGVTAFGPGDVWISGVDADHSGQVLFLHFDGWEWTRSYGPLFRREQENQQYPESDDVGKTSIAPMPSTSGLWTVASVGVGDEEGAFILRRG